MIRRTDKHDETGELVSSAVWDTATGLFTLTEGGVETESRPLTSDEIDRLSAAEAADQAQANRSIVDDAITAALAQLQNLIDAPAVGDVPGGTMTTAQLSNVMRSMRDVIQQNRAGAQQIAQTLKHTIRLVRGDFEGID